MRMQTMVSNDIHDHFHSRSNGGFNLSSDIFKEKLNAVRTSG